MKVRLCAALAFVCLSVPPSVDAQTDEAAIRTLEDQERAAVLQGDRATLERLWSERLTVNTPGNQVNAGRDTVLAIVQGGDLRFAAFERTIEAVRIDGDVAIVMGAEIMRGAGDDAAAVHRRFTNVWKKEDGVWRMIARHANDTVAPE